MTRCPYSRPATYQSTSPMLAARKATQKIASAEDVPSAASAPATTSVGMAGSGRPIRSSSTLAKTNARPYCVIN